jgi:hypothetical protein
VTANGSEPAGQASTGEPTGRASTAEPAGQAGVSESAGRTREANDPADVVGERQVPFFCPYCGEESLWPAGSQPGHWACGGCARNFRLGFIGVRRPNADGSQAAAEDRPAGLIPPPAGAVR